MAVLESVRWEYRGSAAVMGSRTVGALWGHMAVLGRPPDPFNSSGEMQGPSPGP